MTDRDDDPETSDSDKDGLFRRLRKEFALDRAHSADWRKEAKEDFGFVAGEQWSEDDRAHLKSLMRPIITFNRTLPIIMSISGQEISSRQEVRFVPREQGDVKANEILTEASRWFRDQADADDEDSDAFLNSTICGMGWTETTLDFEGEEEGGEPEINAISPLEMFWDRNARKKNLTDAERIWRVRDMALGRVKQMFPEADKTKLDAKWARLDESEAEGKDQDRERLYEDDGTAAGSTTDASLVTIVHVQWKEKQSYHMVADWSGKKSEMSDTEFRTFKKRMTELKFPYQASRRQKSVVKQAWLGSEVLKTNDGLCPDHFHYQCVTAHQDKNKGTFFGLVRQMKDPQRWANKWLSQALDILNNSAKGGAPIIEAGAVADMREFERSWARPDKPTIVPPGTISGQRIMPKPVGAFPAGFFQLMEFAISSVRDVTGVSVEMLGMREANQAASLEYQRRQAGMQILAPLFANLRRYRHDQGRVMLYIIQNYLADGRLVRIVGDEGMKYVPLAKQADTKYDIIVDDSPTSPNQKEATWQMIMQLMPMAKGMMSPQIMMAILEDSPLPSTTVEKLKKLAEESQKGPQAEMQQRMMQLEAALKQVEVQLKGAQTAKTQAETQQIAAETGQQQPDQGQSPDMVKAIGGLQLQKRKQDMDAGFKQQEVAQKGQMDMANLVINAKQRAEESRQRAMMPMQPTRAA